MKKTIVLLLVAALTVGCLVGCFDKKEQPNLTDENVQSELELPEDTLTNITSDATSSDSQIKPNSFDEIGAQQNNNGTQNNGNDTNFNQNDDSGTGPENNGEQEENNTEQPTEPNIDINEPIVFPDSPLK